MKYTIELTDNQKKQMDFMLYMANKHMGFNRKLEMVETTNVEDTNEYQIGYKTGYVDGKKFAYGDAEFIQKAEYTKGYNNTLEDVNHAIDVLKSMTGTECAEWFEDCVGVDEVVCGFTVQRIVEITKAYEEKKKSEDEIKVGDVIYSQMTDSKAIIISFDAWDNWNCIDTCGTGFSIDESKKEFWKKIGHFDEVEQLLDKLRGEE